MAVMVASAIALLLATLWTGKDHASPISIFALSWAGMLALLSLDGAFDLVGYDRVSPGTWAVTLLALVMVTVGWFLAPKPSKEEMPSELTDRLALPLLLFVLCTAGYLLYMHQVMSLCSGRTLGGFFLRWNFEETTGDLKDFGGISGRLAVLPAIAIPLNIYLIARGSKHKKTLVTLTAILFLYLVSPRRALILQTIVSSMFVHVYVKGLSARMIRIMIGTAAAMVFLFSITQLGLNKANGGLGTGFNSAYVYLTSNIPIFHQLSKNVPDTNGEYVLNIPLRITSKFGLNKAPDLSIPFVKVPVEGNTAPFFYYPYRDWGTPGVVVVSCLIGLFSALVYHRRNRGVAWTLVSAFSATAMVFSIRENIFITYQFWYAVVISVLIGISIKYKQNTREEKT